MIMASALLLVSLLFKMNTLIVTPKARTDGKSRRAKRDIGHRAAKDVKRRGVVTRNTRQTEYRDDKKRQRRRIITIIRRNKKQKKEQHTYTINTDISGKHTKTANKST